MVAFCGIDPTDHESGKLFFILSRLKPFALEMLFLGSGFAGSVKEGDVSLNFLL